ncbi:MAG: sigma 54-interacting transcriptional regulator [Ignavibacteriaceae bacterium]|nr:sigma 54-interacting transcriptional regulator [Ignavibacteriaceae bacterium]
MNITNIKTLGELKQSGYNSKSIKDELRDNLIKFLEENKNPFEGIIGFDDTVIPDLQTAVLSRHDILLLGLRGQAKTKIARLMINLLDEYIPVVEVSELNDDPFNPLSFIAKEIIEKEGNKTKISWINRSERYTEKLATPDVSVADLIGDVDPIKAAALKLPYSDERVIHFGLIPRSHRGIFVINELPDLQARIQVALFNILQESDIQIRGFKVRLPLDIQFIFTANPEDYTNRGSIVTPLKDRIDSQILTHYPRNIEISKRITQQEANLTQDQKEKINSDEILHDLVEQIAFEARVSEYIDAKSGVSARLSISAYENLVSTAERRRIINNEKETHLRLSDLYGVIPSITGKIELVYEGEQEGPAKVAQILIGKAYRNNFTKYFPTPDSLKKTQQPSPYQPIIDWFKKGNKADLMMNLTDKQYRELLQNIPNLENVVKKFQPSVNGNSKLLLMEFLLFGLSEFSLLSRTKIEDGIQFRDMLSSMFTMPKEEDFEDEDDESPYKF